MRTYHLLLAAGALSAGLASAQVPDSCAESFFASNNGGNVGGAVYFDVDAAKPVSIEGLRTNSGTTAGTAATLEIWTAVGTSVGIETDPTQWTLHATATGTSAGDDNPTEFLFGTPLDLVVGTTGIALVALDFEHEYTNGTGSNEIHSSADGILTVTGNGASNVPFTGTVFNPRVWNGNLCYQTGGANCVETLFASNNSGSVGGAVYFDLETELPLPFSGLEANFGAVAGAMVGIDVYVAQGSAIGQATTASAWTLVASDDGTALSAGLDLPTAINFAAPFVLEPGLHGIALVAIGTNHAYTNGNGGNQSAASSNGLMSLSAGGATNVPFTGGVFMPRVWNGRLCHGTPNNCVETLYAANNGGADGGAVYFDVDAALPVTLSGLDLDIDTDSAGDGGALFSVEVWTKSGTHVGFETNPAAWALSATGVGAAASEGRFLREHVDFLAPLNLPAGTTGMALVTIGQVGHAYTTGTGPNQVHSSANGALTINAGAASNVPFTGNIFSPRVWNGALCQEGDFIGANFCSAVPNSTGQTGTISATGSADVIDNDVRLIATRLPLAATAFFLTSQSNTIVMMPGTSVGTLCIAGPAIGRYVGPGQVKNSGSSGSVFLDINLNQHPTPTGLIVVLPGESWNFQCWHRDSLGGGATSNFTDALRITFL